MLLTTYTCESPTSGLIRNWCSWYRHEVTVTPGVLFTTQRLPTYLSKRPYYTQGVDLTKAHISRIRFTFGIVYTHIQAEGWVLALPVSRSITSQVSLPTCWWKDFFESGGDPVMSITHKWWLPPPGTNHHPGQRQLEQFCNLTPFRFSSIICLRRNAQCGLYQIVARQALSPPLVYQPERFKDFTRTSQKCEIGSCYQSQIECCQTNYGWLKKLSWGRAKL